MKIYWSVITSSIILPIGKPDLPLENFTKMPNMQLLHHRSYLPASVVIVQLANFSPRTPAKSYLAKRRYRKVKSSNLQ